MAYTVTGHYRRPYQSRPLMALESGQTAPISSSAPAGYVAPAGAASSPDRFCETCGAPAVDHDATLCAVHYALERADAEEYDAWRRQMQDEPAIPIRRCPVEDLPL